MCHSRRSLGVRAVLASACVAALCAGCASLQEAAKGVAGTSTKVLEEGRARGSTQAFGYESDICYRRAQEILDSLGAYVYARKEGMIAFYMSEKDTTPVGIFFTRQGTGTLVEVSSPSRYAREQIAARIFAGIEVAGDLEKASAEEGAQAVR
jgi:hypothetical protein